MTDDPKPAAHLSTDPALLPPLLTPKQVAERWSVRPDHVSRMIQRGDLVALRVGRYLRVRSSDLVHYERSGGADGRGKGTRRTRKATA